jgi:phenylalanyl-tRNA synthetase beta chain
LTNNLQILSENSDSVYPQKIFEVGKVFEKDENEETKIKEKDKLVVSIISESANFTEIKQILDYLFKMLDKKYEIENNDEHPAYINGRSGIIKVNDKKIGEIGEIAPRVLKNWKIKMPVVAFEIEI